MARIGVYICWCGNNIAKNVDVVTLSKEIESIPNVIISKDYKYMCSDPGQDLILQDIKAHNLNRIVLASCSPRMHELTFRNALKKAGLNPYLLEMANIREHVSWVHDNKIEATKKAKTLILAAIARVVHHEPLISRFVEIHPATLVLGGGISGITAALDIADSDHKVFLVEKSDRLGGIVSQLDLTFPYLNSASQVINPLIRKVLTHPNIVTFLSSEIKTIHGYIGNFETTVFSENGKETSLQFGNVIVATGLKLFDPSVIDNYGYGKFPDVITSLELEKMLKSGLILKKDGKEPKNIAIIHCVGSRSRNNTYHPYCSRTCCLSALKYVNQIRSAIPNANIFDIYADMRAMGTGCEELYTATSRKRVLFMMFDQQKDLPVVRKAGTKDKCDMLIEFNELLSSEKIEVPADMIVLMVGMEAQKNVYDVARSVGISVCKNSFFIEKHPKLDPVATHSSGVYIAGTCSAPKGIPESVIQAKAAAARVLATIAIGTVEVEASTAFVNERTCVGCQLCITICPYTAITYNKDKNKALINEVLCKGCGTCVALCRSKSIELNGYTNEQLHSQLIELLNQI